MSIVGKGDLQVRKYFSSFKISNVIRLVACEGCILLIQWIEVICIILNEDPEEKWLL